MYRKFVTIAMSMAAMLVSVGVQAASVDFSVTGATVNQGDTLILTVVGSGFDQDADGGSFAATWDSAVLTYVDTTVSAPPWDTAFVSDDAAGAGELTSVFLGASNNAGINFDVAELTFNVIGDPGTSTVVQLAVDFGWFAPGAIEYTDVSYGSALVEVVPIPVPAAAWLFGSALGLLGWVRRRQIA